MKVASITDYRELARRRLPRFLFEYIDGGANAEVTLRRNVADLEQVTLPKDLIQSLRPHAVRQWRIRRRRDRLIFFEKGSRHISFF